MLSVVGVLRVACQPLKLIDPTLYIKWSRKGETKSKLGDIDPSKNFTHIFSVASEIDELSIDSCSLLMPMDEFGWSRRSIALWYLVGPEYKQGSSPTCNKLPFEYSILTVLLMLQSWKREQEQILCVSTARYRSTGWQHDIRLG